jgi:hypothetical protein
MAPEMESNAARDTIESSIMEGEGERGGATADEVSVTAQPGFDEAELETDLQRLDRALAACQELQDLATKYGISDIFQDNGGKVLQTLILLDLTIKPGREGNDALDADDNEYELKTLNISLGKSRGVTTHHHLNRAILAKYRAVHAWYISLYEGIILQEIYRLSPAQLEPVFRVWEDRLRERGEGASLNNPKIPIAFVRAHGKKVYPATELPVIGS